MVPVLKEVVPRFGDHTVGSEKFGVKLIAMGGAVKEFIQIKAEVFDAR